MKISFNDTHKAEGYRRFLKIECELFRFDWFKECGNWFIYVYYGKDKPQKWFRFSNAGFMKT